MAAPLLHINANPMLHIPTTPNPNRFSLSHRPMMVTMSNNQSYWTSINADIDAHLKQAIPMRPPLSVFEPMHHLTFAAPRSTAPAFCIAACEVVGGHRDQAMAAAAALHLMHAAFFTHEHLPLTDRPRVVRPMIDHHHAFDPNIELLTGDGMIPFGFELLARSDDPTQNKSDRILRVIVEITRAIGSRGMIDGQHKKLQRNESSDGVEWMKEVWEKKEGELYACGGACGAILGGGSEEEVEKLRKHGLYVGMIEGMKNGVGVGVGVGVGFGRNEKVIEELRNLALNELKDFKKAKVEAISILLDPNNCCYV